MEKAYLVLSDGTVFEGERIGAAGDSVGELVFTTGMCGYLETLTDPSYAGQIVLQTFPLIGNYGVIEPDFEGKCAVKGYVVRECCSTPSNFRCGYALDTYLKKQGVCGIAGVDTRRITRILREHGVMNAKICSSIPEKLSDVNAYAVTGVVAEVSRPVLGEYPAETERKHRVVLVDYGAKQNIIRSLCARNCEVIAVPHNTSAKEILALGAEGVMLSNGPGDPAENVNCIRELEKLVDKIPIFGICLGHQLLALAMGGKTAKMKYGHRGVNQPVKEVFGTRTYITSQNHGYEVLSDSLTGVGKIAFINANDGTCEGMDYPGKRCFSVQFHPEACPGPHDTRFLFDRFIAMMEEDGNAKG